MANAFGGFSHVSPVSNLSSSSSLPPEPQITLASNCIRDYFGPVVQTVADALHARGPSTLSELTSNIRYHCLRDWNQERGRLVDRLNGSVSKNNGAEFGYRGNKVNMNKARGSESGGYVTDAAHVRASLIVLIHHSLIKVSGGGNKGSSNNKDNVTDTKQKPDPLSPQTHYTYTFLYDKARLLPRFPRYVDHAQSVIDENAAELVESMLVQGRMRAEDAILSAWGVIKDKLKPDDYDEDDGLVDSDDEEDDDSDNNKALKDIIQSFRKLVEGGYIEMVKPIATNAELDDLKEHRLKQENGIHGGEFEFGMDEDGKIVAEKKKHALDDSSEEDEPKLKKHALEDSSEEEEPKLKKQKITNNGKDAANEKAAKRDDSYGSSKPHHPRILKLLSSHRKLVPAGSVFRVSTCMFHASLRAMVLSRLVSEMYPDDIAEKAAAAKKKNADVSEKTNTFAGPIVRAALTFAARQEHAPLDRLSGLEESEEERHNRMAEWGMFCPSEIVPYLSEEVTKSLKSQVGGLNQNLSNALVRMCDLNYPPIVLEIEEALGHPKGGKFEICTRQLLQRMRDRIVHRVLTTHHGLVAARIVSTLAMKGHSESDIVAEEAMVPAKEAREILHRLHKYKYIDLFDMHMTKTHNTGTAIFLWDVIPSRLIKTVINNVSMAILNLRLRRQHEVEAGKEWMDRAKEAGATDENVHEEDKKKYHAFCKGLERLDCAALQLDESLLVLKDL